MTSSYNVPTSNRFDTLAVPQAPSRKKKAEAAQNDPLAEITNLLLQEIIDEVTFEASQAKPATQPHVQMKEIKADDFRKITEHLLSNPDRVPKKSPLSPKAASVKARQEAANKYYDDLHDEMWEQLKSEAPSLPDSIPAASRPKSRSVRQASQPLEHLKHQLVGAKPPSDSRLNSESAQALEELRAKWREATSKKEDSEDSREKNPTDRPDTPKLPALKLGNSTLKAFDESL